MNKLLVLLITLSYSLITTAQPTSSGGTAGKGKATKAQIKAGKLAAFQELSDKVTTSFDQSICKDPSPAKEKTVAEAINAKDRFLNMYLILKNNSDRLNSGSSTYCKECSELVTGYFQCLMNEPNSLAENMSKLIQNSNSSYFLSGKYGFMYITGPQMLTLFTEVLKYKSTDKK